MHLDRVVLVHYRTPDLLAQAASAYAREAPDVPLEVLDTGGPAHAGDARAALAGHPHAAWRAVPNAGYAAVVNDALRRALARNGAADALLLIANADAWPHAGTLPALLAPFHDPRVAMTGPLARTPGGTPERLGLPYRPAQRRVAGRPHATTDVAWLSGALFVVRTRAARAAGGMDAALRFGNEDLEWGVRLRRSGGRVQLVGADATHVGGASTPAEGRFLVEGLRGGLVTTRRFLGPAAAGVHRAAVAAWATARTLTAPAARRPAWRAAARMLVRGRLGATPFGATLDAAADGFPDAWPPTDADRDPAPHTDLAEDA
ncbi:MAG: glycosyltransferase [Trueperaceae bacterium]|nr:glycosyltransferase [Trueperaceae bacterium]